MKKVLISFLGLLMFLNTMYSQNLASKNGYTFTEQDFEKVVKFVEFVCDKQLTNSEKKQLKKLSR